MEYIILGLLMQRERTLYEIKKVLETSISLFYSASFGSIGTALEKLVAKEWVVLRELVERGRNKKIYGLAPPGAAAFAAWLVSPIASEKVRDPALTRLFFLGHLAMPERIAVIKAHLVNLESHYAVLATLDEANANVTIPTMYEELVVFQQFTLDYGRDYYAFSIDWFKRLLRTLEEQTHDSNQ
jgi:PadR family transcriptional regulator, regulatory protein AphA